MEYTEENYQILKSALKDCQDYLLKLETIPDGGTCNLDSNVIDFTGWKIKDIRRLSSESGVSFSEWEKGSRFINFRGIRGMANLRNYLVESADKHLKMNGVECCIFYQMD